MMSELLISKKQLVDAMYHQAFIADSDMQKWDSGCWIRYKLFEEVLEKIPVRMTINENYGIMTLNKDDKVDPWGEEFQTLLKANTDATKKICELQQEIKDLKLENQFLGMLVREENA